MLSLSIASKIITECTISKNHGDLRKRAVSRGTKLFFLHLFFLSQQLELLLEIQKVPFFTDCLLIGIKTVFFSVSTSGKLQKSELVIYWNHSFYFTESRAENRELVIFWNQNR